MSKNVETLRQQYNAARAAYVKSRSDWYRDNPGHTTWEADIDPHDPAVQALDSAYRAYCSAVTR